MIVSSYTPSNAWYLFSSDLGGNPFAGYSRATLACKYMGNRTARGDPLLSELEPHVAVDIDRYVDALSAFRGLSGFTYGDLGPADIRERLLPYVMGDLRQSRQMWQSLGARETHLYATRVVAFPVRPALTVWVNNAAIPERTRQAFALDVAPGQEVTFFVDVRREFARTVTHNPPPPGAMQAKWCEVQGDWARYLKWETSVLVSAGGPRDLPHAGARRRRTSRRRWLARAHDVAGEDRRRRCHGRDDHRGQQPLRAAPRRERDAPRHARAYRPGQGADVGRARLRPQGPAARLGRALHRHSDGEADRNGDARAHDRRDAVGRDPGARHRPRAERVGWRGAPARRARPRSPSTSASSQSWASSSEASGCARRSRRNRRCCSPAGDRRSPRWSADRTGDRRRAATTSTPPSPLPGLTRHAVPRGSACRPARSTRRSRNASRR